MAHISIDEKISIRHDPEYLRSLTPDRVEHARFRLQNKVWRQINRALDGGGAFGVDQYTLSQGWRDALARVGFDLERNHWT
jgi:hypothetical protein